MGGQIATQVTRGDWIAAAEVGAWGGWEAAGMTRAGQVATKVAIGIKGDTRAGTSSY